MFFKKKEQNKPKKSALREWFDAIIFAVIVATLIRATLFEAFTIPTSSMEKSLLVGDFLFVSKIHYGPRTPKTILQVPLTHQKLWGVLDKIPSYLDWIQLPVFRLPGITKIKNSDVVVFNYPMEDHYPTDLKTNYIKRCVGIPGDEIIIDNTQVIVNNKPLPNPENYQFKYHIVTDGSSINSMIFKKMDITEKSPATGGYVVLTSPDKANKLKQLPNVKEVVLLVRNNHEDDPGIFPHNSSLNWNLDYLGPFTVPKKGTTIEINKTTLSFYERVITAYEGNNNVKVENSKLFIDDKQVSKYTFKQDYYFMMGDNRHNSLDSRFWGFVPEDHVVGKAVLVWLSLDPDEPLYKKVRWKRLFSLIK